MAADRNAYASRNIGDIKVAVIQSSHGDAYVNGVKLAAEQINQRPEKLLNRSLTLSIQPADEDGFEGSRHKVLNIAADPQIVAVLGHGSSSVAVPASVIYEESELIFICSFATEQSLTRHKFRYVFRMVPSNTVLADQITDVAQAFGYKSMVVLHERKVAARELAFLFEDAAVEKGIKLVKRASFFADTEDYRILLSELTKLSFDAVFLSASTEPAARLAKQLRDLGLSQPILGGDGIAGALYAESAGKSASNKTVIPAIYMLQKKSPLSVSFAQAYEEKYQQKPDTGAAQGYDSMMLLAAAIERTQSTITSALSSTLHYMPPFAGVTGLHVFDEAGEVQGKKYFFHALRDGKMYHLPAIEQFYLLNKFDESLRRRYGDDYIFTDFLDKFTQAMPSEDRQYYLLDLAHEMLRFDRIGIIYENTKKGKKIAHYDILKKVAEKKGIEVFECHIPFSFLKIDQIKQKVFACYGKLSLDVDALFVSSYYDLDRDFIAYMHDSLKFYKIPSIAFSGRINPPGITLLLGTRSDVFYGNQNSMGLYAVLLNGIKAYQFYDELSGLPEIIMNLDDLNGSKMRNIILGKPVDVYLQSSMN
jgi:branched-chain amino acid transport system substrate-binding protein